MPTHRALDALPTWAEPGVVHVVVESPRGCGVKLKYEPKLGVMGISRPLPPGLIFPFELGFAPRTRAADGDPIDVAVLVDAATYPGVVLPCRLVAVLRASQKAEGKKGRIRNDRLIAVVGKDKRRAGLTDLPDLAKREREEIEAFFSASVALEDKQLELLGWGNAEEARSAVEAARLPSRPRGAGSRPRRGAVSPGRSGG